MQDAGGRIIACNASAERILGLSLEQMRGLTSLDPRWQATDASGAPLAGEDHPLRITLRTGEPQRSCIMGVARPDGARVWVCINTQPLFRPGETRPYAAVASFSDITESRQAEELLRESEARFRSLYEHTIDGVLLTAPDGRILAANPEACRLLQRTEQEICAAGRDGIVDASDPRLAAMVRERAAKGQVRGELTMIRGDGSHFPIEFSSAIFVDRDGNQRTSLSFRDISERKQVEDALRDANQRLEERVAARTRQLATLLEIGRDVASELELKPLLAHILTELRLAIDYTGAAIAVLEQGELTVVDYLGPAMREKIVGARVSLDRDSGYRQVIERQAPVLVPDIWAEVGAPETAWSIWDESIAAEIRYARSWLGVPLLAKGKLIGLLRLDHSEPDHFTQEDVEWTVAFGYQVAVAIVNAQWHLAALRAAALAERERIARELHDSVSQVLYSIGLGVHSTRERLGPDLDWVAAKLDYIGNLVDVGLAEMRALILELYPEVLARGGLVHALGRHVEMLRGRYGLSVEWRFDGEPDLPADAKLALYRIAQEATNNAAKHARASNVSLSLASDAGATTLEIIDNGRGFDPAGIFAGRLGLKSMQERAEQIGATWEVESEAGSGRGASGTGSGGTRIRVRVPHGEQSAA